MAVLRRPSRSDRAFSSRSSHNSIPAASQHYTSRTARQELGYMEGPQVEQALGLRLNQALIGEMSSGKALNLAAREIKDIFEKSGRKTGLGPALPE